MNVSFDNFTANNNDGGSGFDFVAAILLDARGNRVGTDFKAFLTGSFGLGVPFDLTLGTDAAGLGGITAPLQRPFTLQVYETANIAAPFALGALLSSITFDPVAAPSNLTSCAGLQLGAAIADLAPAMHGILESSLRARDWAVRTQVVNRLFGSQTGSGAAPTGFTGSAFAPLSPSVFGVHSSQLKDMLKAERDRRSAEVVLAQAQTGQQGGREGGRTGGQGGGQPGGSTGGQQSGGSGGGTGGQTAQPGTGPPRASTSSAISFWFSGSVSGTDFDQAIVGYNGHSYHLSVGGDWKPNQRTVIGVLAGYDRSDTSTIIDNTDLDGDTYTAGGYFGFLLAPRLMLDGSAGHGSLDFDFRGDFNAGRYDAHRYFANLGLTGFADLGPLQFRPRVGFRYAKEKQDAYTDAAGFRQPGGTTRVEQLVFGTELRLSNPGAIQPFVRVYGERDSERLTDELAASIGGGAEMQLGPRKTLKFEYTKNNIGRPDLDSFTVHGYLSISLQ